MLVQLMSLHRRCYLAAYHDDDDAVATRSAFVAPSGRVQIVAIMLKTNHLSFKNYGHIGPSVPLLIFVTLVFGAVVKLLITKQMEQELTLFGINEEFFVY